MMNRLITTSVGGLLLASAVLAEETEDNRLTDQQQTDGWEVLFDGQTLDNWSVRTGFATYKIEEGSVVGTTAAGSPNTFLTSSKTFADFELLFDVQVEHNPLNSGVQIRSKLRDDQYSQYGGRLYGPQVEVEAGPGQSGFIYGEGVGGWISQEPMSSDPKINQHDHFKNGKWNHYRVLAVGRKIQTWVNGEQVADVEHHEKGYEANKEGAIGLQVHGVGNAGPFRVRWKNIYIRPITGEAESSSDKKE